ncbi:MAG: glutaredoxin family protein [Candidatus Bathyarchaeota archaeon]|jgi:glutaredoxin-like protein NrdH|nr:glutaredoxin family protein [Candidatus Bathyarchaeota archaeon]
MRTTKVPGENNKHRVLMYALSTCGWCKRAKRLLRDNSIEYEYIDVDLCSMEDRERIRRDILSRGGRLSYPTIIVDDTILITSFQEDRIREALEI